MTSAEPSILDWDLSWLGDEDYLAYLRDFPGSGDIVELSSQEEYSFSGEIFFTGNFQKLKQLDYPYTDVRWPLMSARMISTLQSAGEANLREIPVTILDDTVPGKKLFTDAQTPKPEYACHRFVGVQLLDHLDAFDWERSQYERSSYLPELVDFIDTLALKPVRGGYPPIFRLTAYPTLILVSEEARSALEQEKMTGVEMYRVSEYPKRP